MAVRPGLRPSEVGHTWTGLLRRGEDTWRPLVRAVACGFDLVLLVPFVLFTQGDLVTIYQGQITKDSSDLLKCTLDEYSSWYPHTSLDVGAFWRLRDACAGLGGIAMGLNQMDISATAHLDANEFCCNTLKMNDAKGVIHGDINNHQDVEQLHSMDYARKSLLAGQPLSTQGDRLGHQDPRSTTFWGVLRAAWLLRPSTLILECAANMARFPFIAEGLHTLANMMGYQECTLQISCITNGHCRRDRWWALVAPALWTSRTYKPGHLQKTSNRFTRSLGCLHPFAGLRSYLLSGAKLFGAPR